MIDYRMETFLTLCDKMNYRAAAQHLNITQPAVTQHIQFLEEHYGCRLFTYDKRKLHMTKEACLLKQYALSMNYQERKLRESLFPKKGYQISLGATKTIGEYVIRKQTENFLKTPENQIQIEIDNTARILDSLDHGRIDFALIEGYFDRNRYDSKLYRREPFVGFCSTDHPFAGQIVELKHILKENLFVREEGSGTRNILQQLLESENYSFADFSKVTSIGNFGLLEHLAAVGMGITFAYEAAGINNKKLAKFQVKGWNLTREFNYVYLKDTKADEAVRLFDSYR